jgi:hypothetical protein
VVRLTDDLLHVVQVQPEQDESYVPMSLNTPERREGKIEDKLHGNVNPKNLATS